MPDNILQEGITNSQYGTYPFTLGTSNSAPNTVVRELFPATTVIIHKSNVEVVREIVPPALWTYCDEVISHNMTTIERLQQFMADWHLHEMYVQLLDYVYTDYPYHVTSKVWLLEVKDMHYVPDKVLQTIGQACGIPISTSFTVPTSRRYCEMVRSSNSWYKRGQPYGLYFRPTVSIESTNGGVLIHRFRFDVNYVQRLVLGESDEE